MKKIRVLFTISELVYGSKVRQLIDLVKEIDRDKFDPEIGTYHVDDEATSDILSLRVPVRQLWLQPPRQLVYDRFVKFFESLYKIYNRYDIIHSLQYSSLFYEPLISRMGKAKYIYTKTNLKWDNHPINWKLKSTLSNKILAISSEVNNLMIRKGFQSKTEFIPLGIDIDYFRPSTEIRSQVRSANNIPEESFVFGCAAQFINTKKQDLVLKAFHELSNKYKDIYLVMCGPNYNDEYYREISSMMESSGTYNNVHNLGVVRDMRSFYNLIDCFVLPSVDEALGLVFLEAMSTCVPAIGCEETGARDIIQGDCGVLVERNNIKSVIDAMEYYINNKRWINGIGEKCRKQVIDKFDNKLIVKKHEEIYSSMVD